MLLGLATGGIAQDTFSLIAYDASTGELVSAGASCIDRNQIAGGARIISSVHPGLGVVHTQSIWEPGNQAIADSLLLLGLPAKRVVHGVTDADVAGVPGFRQYGALSLADSLTRAAFTGESCFPWAGQLLGEDYVLVGNILRDAEVLRDMQRGFEAARDSGAPLAACAMASLRAAAYAGADRRCTSAGISSRSAFLRLARPGDASTALTLDLVIDFPAGGRDPILLLEEAFDEARVAVGTGE